MFCNHQLLVSSCFICVRSNIDGAKHGGPILKLLAQALRAKWPEVKIVFRCQMVHLPDGIFSTGEHNGIEYLVGLSQNNRIIKLAKPTLELAQQLYDSTKEKNKNYIQSLNIKPEHGTNQEELLPKLNITVSVIICAW